MSELRIKCEICDDFVHVIKSHLSTKHPETTMSSYRQQFPNAALFSEMATTQLISKHGQEKADQIIAAASVDEAAPISVPATVTAEYASMQTNVKKPLWELFGFPKSLKSMKNGAGEYLNITCLEHPRHPEMVPARNDNYVHDIEDLKDTLMALEENMPLLVWGHAGTGKTELIEDICARTNRPMVRVQHTANTEESHIVGQWVVRDGATVFELGPLPLCMINGWTYLGDEYDFALPHINSVYQPVLEGKALYIKEADAANRLIKPHPDFRFAATGNTNGSGDETGLYSGTNIQNAANYDRFAMVIHKKYLPSDAEIRLLVNHTGIEQAEAQRLVEFAEAVRKAYDGRKISGTISPRALINIANIGMRKASYRVGVMRSFSGKLNAVDREAVDQMAQRLFGG